MNDEPIQMQSSHIFIDKHKIDIAVITVLFFSILAMKILLINWFNSNIGDFFYLTKSDGAASILRKILFSHPTSPIPTQAYDDVWYHYIPYVEAFSNGWNPYTNSGLPADSITGKYNYGPLYIIFISIGTILFDMDPFNSIYWSNLLFDVSGMVVFYLIARHYKDKFLSILITIILSFSPVMFLYVDFKLLNMPQMTFFTLLFFLLFLKGRHNGAVISLAFGFMTKFIPVFIMLPLLIYYWRINGRQFALKKFLLFLVYTLVLMLPFFILSPSGFMDQFLSAGAPYQEDNSSILQVIRAQVLNNIGFILWFALLAIIIWFSHEKIEQCDYTKLRIFTYFLFGVHSTFWGIYTRGFKYYDVLLLPFVTLTFFIYSEKELRWFKLLISIGLFYLVNVLIINLPPYHFLFNHFRFFFLFGTFCYFIWMMIDLKSELRINIKEKYDLFRNRGKID